MADFVLFYSGYTLSVAGLLFLVLVYLILSSLLKRKKSRQEIERPMPKVKLTSFVQTGRDVELTEEDLIEALKGQAKKAQKEGKKTPRKQR